MAAPDCYNVTFALDRDGEALGLVHSNWPTGRLPGFWGRKPKNVSMGRSPRRQHQHQRHGRGLLRAETTSSITAPVLTPIPDQVVYPGQTLSLYAAAEDYDIPNRH